MVYASLNCWHVECSGCVHDIVAIAIVDNNARCSCNLVY